MLVSSPQPSVLHLVTIFRQIASGDIRIPAFQRNFVWREKQMVELLDSVLNGYPIGSILLWAVDAPMLKIAPSEVSAFPTLPEHFPTSYVLDGMQRLSTLYGVFNFGNTTTENRFDIQYDLALGVFFQNGQQESSETAVPLSALFVPRQLLEHQARLARRPDGDDLIERLLVLQAAFQDYMIPVVTIRSGDVSRIVGIFEKINSTGTRLDPVDFMRAITWAEDFDLNHYLDAATQDLGELGFDLSPETIVKCVGMTLGISPTTDGLLQLRNRKPNELDHAFGKAMAGLTKTIAFLKSELSIGAYSYIPYEGQLLLLFRTIGLGEATDAELPEIVRWFWACGFNEALRGKPDHYVVRAVDNWRALIEGRIRGLEPRLRLDALDLAHRRLVTGAALSATFVTMHAETKCRSFVTGQIIDPSTYMSVADPAWFEPVFTRAEIAASPFGDVVSAKLFSNVVLMDDASRQRFGQGGAREALKSAAERGDWDALHSQFIDKDTFDALVAGEIEDFLMLRAFIMLDEATRIVGDPEAAQTA